MCMQVMKNWKLDRHMNLSEKEKEIALAWEYGKKEYHAQSKIVGVGEKQEQRIVLIVKGKNCLMKP